MAPLFDLCHYLLAALAVRADGGLGRSRSHPLATWLATMSASFAGSLLANPLLGKPILAAVSNEYQVLDGNILWISNISPKFSNEKNPNIFGMSPNIFKHWVCR